MVEPWAHEHGALVIVPLQRADYGQNLWTIAARVRPYSERGKGKGGRPATLLTAWPMPASSWAEAAPRLLPVIATKLAAKPLLEAAPASERFKGQSIQIEVPQTPLLTIKELPLPAIVMIEALRRRARTLWTKATFLSEAEFLACVSIVYTLVPRLGHDYNEPRALLSVASGLAVGAENFQIRYLRDASRSANENRSVEIPRKWKELLDKRPEGVIDDLAHLARSEAISKLARTAIPRFGHTSDDGNWWAADALADTLPFYDKPYRSQNISGRRARPVDMRPSVTIAGDTTYCGDWPTEPATRDPSGWPRKRPQHNQHEQSPSVVQRPTGVLHSSPPVDNQASPLPAAPPIPKPRYRT